MPEPTKRKGFLTIGRLILMVGAGSLAALLHWLVLPEEPPSVALHSASSAQSITSGSANAPVRENSSQVHRPSLADILAKPYWLRTELILAYLDGADAAATADLFQALVPDILSYRRSQHFGGDTQEWNIQLLFIFSHWVKLDPQEMMARVQSFPLGNQVTFLAFSLWARVDWRTARANLSPGLPLYFALATEQAEAVENPTGMLERLRLERNAGGAVASSSSVAHAALHQLFKTDRALAMTEMFRMLPLYTQPNSINGVHMELRQFLERAPEQTMAQMRSVAAQDPAMIASIMATLHSNLTDKFPQYLDDWIKFSPPGSFREGLQNQAVVARMKADPEAALEAARSANDTTNLSLALRVLSAADPQRWLQEMKNEPPSEARNQQAVNGIRALAEKEPQAALEFAQTLTGQSSVEAMSTVARCWAEAHPKASLPELLEFYPTASGDAAFLSAIAESQVNSNPNAALDLAKGATEPIREGVMSEVLAKITRNSPGFVWDKLDLIPHDANRDKIIAQALTMPIDTSNGHQSTDAVLGRWNQLDATDQTPRVTANVAATLYRIDATKASIWVRDLPEGTARDAATVSLVTQIAHDTHGPADFSAAWQWASTIQNPQQRLQLLRSTAGAWLATDANGLAAAVSSAALPDADKELLRASFLLPTP